MLFRHPCRSCCLLLEQRLFFWTLRFSLCVWAAVFGFSVNQVQADSAAIGDVDHPVSRLPDLIVQAWHFDRSVLETPADVTRIDRAVIDRSLAASLPDLLAVEANLFFSNVSGFNNVAMRGFGEGSGLRSLILVDGQPLNPADMGPINWEQVPLDSIESVEVLRGGHNVLYGDKALSGVIKIETRRTNEARLNLEGRLASFGRSQASISGGFGGDSWSLQGGLFRDDFEGYRANSQSDTRNGYLKVGTTFANGDDLDLGLALGQTDLTYPGGLDQATYRADPRASGNLGDEGSENRYLTATARFVGQRDWGEVELLAGRDQSHIDWTFGAGSFGQNEQAGYSFKPRARFGSGAHALIVGVDALYDTLDFTQFLDAERTLVPSETKLSESRISPYLLTEVTLQDRLTLSSGVRHEWVRYEVDSVSYDRSQLRPVLETNKGDFPNPNFKNPPDVLPDASFAEVVREHGSAAEFSVNFKLTRQTSLWAGYDRVYRYPVFDERAAYQGVPLAQNVSQDLEAETGDSFEAGLKYLGARHEFYLTVFLLLMENEIIFDPDVEAPDSFDRGLNVNLGPVRRQGIDLAYIYTNENWGASTRLGWVRTDMRSDLRAGVGRGQEVPLVPDFRATNQIWWKPVPALRLRGIHRYVGERFQGGDFGNVWTKVSDYHLFDIHAEWTLNVNSRLFASVENIFDQNYAESVFRGSYFPGDGRSVTVGVKFNF